jgi:lipid-binding SYLF domain-containing protein
MKARISFILTILFTLCLAASTVHAATQDDVDRAVSIIERFEEIPEKAIPPTVLRDAKGVASVREG